MNIFKYILFGILQGLTEPLPISSSGHLYLFKNLFETGMIEDLNFEIVLNFGSFLAILFIFWKDIVVLLKSFFTYLFSKKKKEASITKNFRYCMMIIIGSIPVGIAGLLFKDKIEALLSSVQMLGVTFLITALALYLVRNANGKKGDYDITWKNALLIGFIQVIALFPGISRSGSVLVGCLLCGLSRSASLKYTFMLYFPVSVASMGLGIIDMIQTPGIGNLILPYIFGMIAAFIVTYFSYRWLSEWVKKGKLWKFSIYCLFLGMFVLIYFR